MLSYSLTIFLQKTARYYTQRRCTSLETIISCGMLLISDWYLQRIGLLEKPATENPFREDVDGLSHILSILSG